MVRGAPAGDVPLPVTVRFAGPGAIASKSSAASSPVPATPVTSPVRAIAMSIRPLVVSDWFVKAADTPPVRMKLPSCTVRARSTAGL
jgi:hypothetical protein